jgi:uncharacterized protein (TIGR03083 family)
MPEPIRLRNRPREEERKIVDTEPSHWISALQGSHERLQALVEPLDGDRLRGPSYASEWSIAQVLSHLGSGAEIFERFLDAGLTGGPLPGREDFEPIWAAWNAKPAEACSADAIVSDAAFVDRISSLDPTLRDQLHFSLFGMDLDIVGLVRMRLGEHAVHTWDVAVALDDSATVAPDAVALLVDTLGQLVARTGKPTDALQHVTIHATDPERAFTLDIGDSVTLTEASDAAGPAELLLPSEALLRLVYGRLDAAHSPRIETSGADLDVLRGVFPGF